jgi:hypothetical protein
MAGLTLSYDKTKLLDQALTTLRLGDMDPINYIFLWAIIG